MKSFEKEIRKRILWSAIFAVLGGLSVIAAFWVKQSGSIAADSGLPLEILMGFFIGIEFTAIYRIIKYGRALNQSETLEAMHIKERDERNRIVALKTCRLCIYLTFGLLGLAGIITSFFSQTVFLTIGAILIGLIVLYSGVAFYYSRKF